MASDPAYADRCLSAGRHVYDLADTRDGVKLLTVSPHDYYPESQWRDDLELGATELATAVAATNVTSGRLGDRSAAQEYLLDAAHWAGAYLESRDRDTLNLYDVAGLAHAELLRAVDDLGDPGGLEVSPAELRKDLRAKLDSGVRQARHDPFGVGVPYGYDVAGHLFGLVVGAPDYEQLTGSHAYEAFLDAQLGAVFGANAWGVSFVVGAGELLPDCMQHQIANLSGSLDGSDPVDIGAVVNGPNRPGQFHGLGLPSGARDCPPHGGDPYAAFTGQHGRFVDNVRAWPSVEPTIDFTASSVLALARVATC